MQTVTILPASALRGDLARTPDGRVWVYDGQHWHALPAAMAERLTIGDVAAASGLRERGTS